MFSTSYDVLEQVVRTHLAARENGLESVHFHGPRTRAAQRNEALSKGYYSSAGRIHCASHKPSPRSSAAAKACLRRCATAASKALQTENAAV